jgi:hypothetical protein
MLDNHMTLCNVCVRQQKEYCHLPRWLSLDVQHLSFYKIKPNSLDIILLGHLLYRHPLI